jgi:hypothetical protein
MSDLGRAIALSSILLFRSKLIQAAFEWDKENEWANRSSDGRFSKGTQTLERPKLIQPPTRESPKPAESPAKPKPAAPVKRKEGSSNINEHHVLKGDIADGKLGGGLHTQKGLEEFCETHGHEYKVLRTNARNGVKEIQLPLSAMKPLPNGSVLEPKKTLFPSHWSDDDVLKAITEVAETSVKKLVGNREVAEGIVKGVLIRVAFRHSRIVTAFPKF